MDNEIKVSRIDTDSQNGSYRQSFFKKREKGKIKEDNKKDCFDKYCNEVLQRDFSKVKNEDLNSMSLCLNSIIKGLNLKKEYSFLLKDMSFRNLLLLEL